jgi:hypothetical protein
MGAALPCPFCGRPPRWQDNSSGDAVPFRRLACGNPACTLEVQTRRVASDEELIRDWNSRVPPEQAVLRNQIREHLRAMLKRAKEICRR